MYAPSLKIPSHYISYKNVCHVFLTCIQGNLRIAPNNEKVHEHLGRVIQYYKCSVFYYGESKSILPEPIYNTRNIFSTQHRLREKKKKIMAVIQLNFY